jgi:hypothetical protein
MVRNHWWLQLCRRATTLLRWTNLIESAGKTPNPADGPRTLVLRRRTTELERRRLRERIKRDEVRRLQEALRHLESEIGDK